MNAILRRTALTMTLIAGALLSHALFSQTAGVQRTVLQRKDISVPGHETVVVRVDLAPGVSAGRHTHPGEEISYVIDGQGEILIDGQPPLKIKQGESFIVPAGAKHDAHNTGTVPLKLLAVYVVEKGQPLLTPAP
jgi:quercetin dioxygenase-like cupin family protein